MAPEKYQELSDTKDADPSDKLQKMLDESSQKTVDGVVGGIVPELNLDVVFHQQRAGRAGRSFALIKFRTMLAGRTPDPKELVPLNHPDITTVGRLLRRTKIDELPQLFNVLAGHMSVVGPRPTLPDQIERYDLFERRRLQARPGCTGLAQVNGNIALSWSERIKWDVYYVDNHSFWMDVKILLKTVLVIVAGEQRFLRHIDQTDFAKDG